MLICENLPPIFNISCSNLSIDVMMVKDIEYSLENFYDLSSGNFIEIYSSSNIFISNVMLINCRFYAINFLYIDIF